MPDETAHIDLQSGAGRRPDRSPGQAREVRAPVAVKARGAVDVVRNAIALMFSTVVSSAFGMIFWIVAARLFDVADLGRAAAAVSAITLLGGFAQLSLHSVFIRFLPTAGEATRQFVGISYLASGAVAMLLAVGFFTLGLSTHFLPAGPFAFVGFCVAVVCSSFSGLQDSVLTALRRTTWVPVENIAIALGKLGLLPVLAGGAVVAPLLIAWTAPLVIAVVALSAIIFLRLVPAQTRRMRGRQALPTRREFLAFITAQNLSGIVSNLTIYLPPLLVTVVLGNEQGGLFYLPWLIGTALIALTWNILVSMVVEASTDLVHIRAQLRHALRLLLLVSVGGGLLMVAGAPVLLAVLGAKYVGGAASLRLIGLGVPFGVVGTLFSITGYMAKKSWPIFFSQLASTVIFLGGAWFALTQLRFGAAGAAGAFLVSEAVVGLALLPVTVRRLRELVRSGEEQLASAETVLIPSVAATVARGRATVVSRPSPGYDTGPMQVVFLPVAAADWERAETMRIDRLIDAMTPSGSQRRWNPEATVPLPLPRLPSHDGTVPPPASRGYRPGYGQGANGHLNGQGNGRASGERTEPVIGPLSRRLRIARGEPLPGQRRGRSKNSP